MASLNGTSNSSVPVLSAALLVFALAMSHWAQDAKPLPRFEDYPAKNIYKGRRA